MTDNKDLNQRFDNLEARLDSLASASRIPHTDSHFPEASRSDEIDLRELFSILWQGKWWIIGITFLFAVAGVFYALSLPNMYKSEGVYASAERGAGGGLAGQYGGLAAIAGISLGGGEAGDVEQAVELVSSWPFIERFIEKKGIAPYLLAVSDWDVESGKFLWDQGVYSPDGGWVEGKYSGYLAYKSFSKLLDVKVNSKSGLITVSLEYYSPKLASEWLVELMAAVNEEFRMRDVKTSLDSVAYLEDKIEETSVGGVTDVLYGMIEEQLKTLMLAELREEYLLSTVVSVKTPELPSSPRRLPLLILFVFVGAVCGVVAVLLRRASKG